MRTRFVIAILIAGPVFTTTACLAESLVAVSSRGDGTVKLYTPVRDVLRLVTSIPAGKSPGEMCVDPNGTRLFVAQVPEKQMGILDLQKKDFVGNITDPGIKNIDGCAVSPDSAKLYVVDREVNAVFVFNLATHQLLKKIDVGEEPRHLLFTRDGKTLLLTNAGAATLTLIDPAADTVQRTIKTGQGPQDLAFTPDGKWLIIGLVDDDAIAYFKADTFEFEQEVGTLQSPQRVVPAKDSQLVYVSGHMEGAIAVMNLRPDSRLKNRMIQQIKVGNKSQWGLTMSADGKYLYSTQPSDNTVAVVDLQLMKSVFTLPVPGAGAILFCK
jgi:YVTN family beta-propeller protein